MSTKKTPRVDPETVKAVQDGELPVAALYPLSQIAAPEQVRAAGICNGWTAEQVEAALARVMG